MMTWTHRMCDKCWYKSYKRDPVRVRNDMIGKCCFCGNDTESGIYVRHDPRDLGCEENHEKEDVI